MDSTTAPPESHVVIVGTYRGTDTPALLEHLTPDYSLPERIRYWTTSGWTDVHTAQQTVRFVRLTADEAEAQRTPREVSVYGHHNSKQGSRP